MNNFSLSADEAEVVENQERFAVQLNALGDLIGRLQAHARARVRSNLESHGFPRDVEVELDLYLERTRVRPVDKETAFVELRDHFVQPS